MLKLVSEVGRFALKDNSMIFSNVVYLVDKGDIKLYHLINDNDLEEIDKYVDRYLIEY